MCDFRVEGCGVVREGGPHRLWIIVLLHRKLEPLIRSNEERRCSDFRCIQSQSSFCKFWRQRTRQMLTMLVPKPIDRSTSTDYNTHPKPRPHHTQKVRASGDVSRGERCSNLGPTQSRISPDILEYTKILRHLATKSEAKAEDVGTHPG